MELTRHMIRFAKEAYGPDVLHEAWREFSLWDEEAPPLDLATPHRQIFVPWAVHIWAPGVMTATSVCDRALHGVPPTRAYLTGHGADMEPGRRRYLEACLATPCTFHEVVGGSRREGLHTRDVLTDEECAVCHMTQRHPLVLNPGAIVYGQCVQLDGAGQFEALSPVAIPVRYKDELIDRGRPPAPWIRLSPDYRRRHDLKLRALYFDLAGAVLGGGAGFASAASGAI
jgi:hypothetical protein